MSAREHVLELKARIAAAVIGQEAVVEQLLIALLADGHILMEGLPGLAKTRTIKTLGKNLESKFSRIQFTPDLLPSDITGTEIYLGEAAGGKFRHRRDRVSERPWLGSAGDLPLANGSVLAAHGRSISAGALAAFESDRVPGSIWY